MPHPYGQGAERPAALGGTSDGFGDSTRFLAQVGNEDRSRFEHRDPRGEVLEVRRQLLERLRHRRIEAELGPGLEELPEPGVGRDEVLDRDQLPQGVDQGRRAWQRILGQHGELGKVRILGAGIVLIRVDDPLVDLLQAGVVREVFDPGQHALRVLEVRAEAHASLSRRRHVLCGELRLELLFEAGLVRKPVVSGPVTDQLPRQFCRTAGAVAEQGVLARR